MTPVPFFLSITAALCGNPISTHAAMLNAPVPIASSVSFPTLMEPLPSKLNAPPTWPPTGRNNDPFTAPWFAYPEMSCVTPLTSS